MKSSLSAMVLSLGIITAIAGAILAGIHELTAAPIAEARRMARVNAVRDVCPDFDNDPIADCVEIFPTGESTAVTVYPAIKNGKLSGGAVESYSMDGFSGEIKIMCGFDNSGHITGYQVISHAETPGLGAKMDEWFRSSEGHRSVIGIDPMVTNVTVAKDGGDVDAITAATITSRAFLDAIHRAHTAFSTYRESNFSSINKPDET